MNDEQRRLAGRGYESCVILLREQIGRCGMALGVLLFATEFRAGLPILLSVSFPVVRAADLFPAVSEFEKNVRPVGCLLLVS
jgi:hypothetical protein